MRKNLDVQTDESIAVHYEDNSGLIERVRTGLWTFDWAVGSKNSYGFPTRSLVEIYGRQSVGKSSLSYFLAGKLSGKSGGITLMDLEGFDRNYVVSSLKQANFSGQIRVIPIINKKGKILSHSEMADDFLNNLYTDPNYSVGILDSVGAFVSNAESAGDTGDANMGKRAIAVNQIMRKVVAYSKAKETPMTVLIVNHVHSVVGGYGHLTPGGEALKYLAATRIFLRQVKAIESGDRVLGFHVGGKLEKLRFGGRGRGFNLVIIPDFGVSPELTAVFDCVSLGLATDDRTIKLGDKTFGYISKVVDLAMEGKKDKFNPFFEALEDYYGKLILGNSMVAEPEINNPNHTLKVLDE